MKRILIQLSLLLPCFAFAQSRLVLNNDGYIVISNSAYLVIDNGNANAITLTGTGGRIITEAENNRIRWNISNNTGSYVIPFFDDDNATKIPFTVTIGTAGSAGGRIDFSTYDNASWDNNVYRPSDVTNMNSLIGGTDDSPKVIDRFWITDASSYTTKPSATLSFTYIDAEWSAAGNTITEGNLGAQRFNTPAGNWDAYVPQGSISTAANTVTNVPATSANFFRSWTLTDNTSPLPIELISFTGVCANGNLGIKWSTATETNNNYFTIEKSIDGIEFEAAATINGAGNSSSVINYSYTDTNPFNGTYYRLAQTDFNGNSKKSGVIYVAACDDPNAGMNVFSQGANDFTIQIDAAVAENYTVTIYNMMGQVVASKSMYVDAGIFKTKMTLENMDDAMYFVNISNGTTKKLTKKIVISHSN
ncbi:MAG: hypothetical protein JWP12_1660 [Bacteroidetes bacterium]|nr:hypothetical protein [Bacteroidota bacterium]